jgi:two-component system CheB/CheR fusion protein
VGLALHELATNAAKFGALSAPGGKIKVSWAFAAEEGEQRALVLNWIENGGPPVAAPANKGFGHLVIERMAANALDGVVAMDFTPQGLRWSLSIPAANVVSEGRARKGPER